ncbi:MAG: DUF934 domain-containing protein [Pikeienuella sp.]
MTLRDDSGIIPDNWTFAEAGEALSGPTILSLVDAVTRDLSGVAASDLGLHIDHDTETADLPTWFDKVSLISVNFPNFANGRGFSIARRLREQGFSGRLRATGHLIADQYAYLRACGFDEVKVSEKLSNRQPQAHWDAAAKSMTIGYQRGYSGVTNALDARRATRT